MADVEHTAEELKPKIRNKRSRDLSAIDGRIFKAEERQIFARNIRAARLSHGWSTYDLGRKIDAAATYVTLIESGRANISIDRMATFAKALGHPLHSLLHLHFIRDIISSCNDSQLTSNYEHPEVPAKGRPLKPDK